MLMRYHIIRQKIRIVLWLTLLAAVFVSIAPQVYKNIFTNDEFLDYTGVYDFDRAPAMFTGDTLEGSSLEMSFLNNDFFVSRFDVKDFKLNNINFSADIFLKGRLTRNENGELTGFSGKLFAKETSFNSKPFKDVSMSFDIANNELEIKSMRIGTSYELVGTVGLLDPFTTDLRLQINRADIRDFTLITRSKRLKSALGIISGEFEINGNLENLYSNGTVQSRNGKIGIVEYDMANIKLEGFGPIINIVDSRVKWGKGTFAMDGYVDLRSIGKGGLFGGISVRSDMKGIIWDGWDIEKKGMDELNMTKDISDDMSVGFKSVAREPLTTYYERDNPEEMSLEFKDYFKMKMRENEEFFVIEHSVKF